MGDDLFGWSASLSGNRIAIGAVYDDDLGNSSGSAYLFVGNGANWRQANKLIAGDGGSEDQFGATVSISGNNLVIGALLHAH